MTKQEKRDKKIEKKEQEKRVWVRHSYDFYDDDDNDLFFVDDDDEYTKGYGIKPIETFTGAPSTDPKKMLIKITVLLPQIYVGYSSKEITKKRKQVLKQN